jgi:capsule assembly protein Wzi/PAP2 superfamily protein
MRGRTFRVKVLALGWMWTLASLGVAGSTKGAAKPQEPEVQNGAQSAQNQKEKEDGEKNKTETPKDPNNSDQDSTSGSPRSVKRLGKDFLEDQKQIWTSPVRLRFVDANWLVPAAGFTAGLFVTDRDYSKHLSNDPHTLSQAKTFSDAGLAALIGGAGAMYLLSYPAHREHWRETGFLAGEAAINSLVAVEALKYTLRRERPYQGDGSGPFFSGGTSFPSEHAAAAWSVAGVIAHEYPGPVPKILAYGLASLVSYARIKGKQHFPSDVFVGSMMGQMIAQDVYSRRHDPELGGGQWASFTALARAWESGGPQNLGTPYVPLDSWVYPALERLAGLGLIDSAFSGMRPWTRRECMRQVAEASEKLGDTGDASEASRLVDALEREFRAETEALGDGTDPVAFRLESLYTRTEHISGSPLTDGFHFGQTQINDFGRPYGQGWSTINGFSAYATSGPWVTYVRGEAQTAPAIPALPLTARETVQAVDFFPREPLPPDTPTPSVQQFKLLDAYVGLMLSNWEVSFGKQSLWWGPGDGGPLDFSNNSQPIEMFRINRTTPLKLPSILGWLGPMRTEFFLGRLSGFEFITTPTGLVGQWGQSLADQPFIHGQKISFKPTRNFEFGFFRTTIFAGEGFPFTLHTLAQSLFSAGNTIEANPNKPGNRTSALDFSYRLPKLRDWVTFYGEGYTDDQYSPIAYADRSAWQAGLYFSHFPLIPKLDLRVEGVYTDVPPGGGPIAPGVFYANGTWRSGYTNNGYLIGNWVGRGGQGGQAWTNYWFGARNRLQFNFRHQKVSQVFIPGGGTLTDVGARGDYWMRPNLSVSASVQYERWLFPVIQPKATTNVSATVEILFQPQKLFRHSAAEAPGGASEDREQP